FFGVVWTLHAGPGLYRLSLVTQWGSVQYRPSSKVGVGFPSGMIREARTAGSSIGLLANGVVNVHWPNPKPTPTGIAEGHRTRPPRLDPFQEHVQPQSTNTYVHNGLQSRDEKW